jgi:hypothetical protein
MDAIAKYTQTGLKRIEDEKAVTIAGGERSLARAGGKPRMVGAYTDQRLNLSKLWEGPRRKCQGFKPDPGNPAVRDYRGLRETSAMVGMCTRPAIERAGNGNPPPTAGRARFLSQSSPVHPRRLRRDEPTGYRADMPREVALGTSIGAVQ